MPETFFLKILNLLERSHGNLASVPLTDPFEMILFENVAYLASDEQRSNAFAALKNSVGLQPTDILNATGDRLLEVAKLGGPVPELRIEKLRDIARTTIEEFSGNLNIVRTLPINEAKKALRKFPGIGGPGAEKILLFTRTHPLPVFDSNGLRVLTRVGISDERKNYSATYRSAVETVKAQTEPDIDLFIKAYDLFRRHGQQICKRKSPMCSSCALREDCRYFLH